MNRLKVFAKLSCLILVLVGVLFAGLWLLNAPEGLTENSQSKERLDRAEYSVGTQKLVFTDTTRMTPALGDYEGAEQRTLNGTIWFPKGEGVDHPLIVFSHGFGSYHKGCRHLAKYLARNGYVVAAVDFPLSNMNSLAGSPQLLDIVNQPGDVSAVIDEVLKLNSNPNSAIHQRIDQTSIGVMGLSLGGLTTALISFHPDYQDERIQAAVMLAPPLEAFSTEFYANNPKLNSLLISGSLDRVVPEHANAEQVKTRQSNGWFISLDKGSHLGFANVSNPIRWMENPDDLGCHLMDMMLSKLDLPERWDTVIPNTGGVLRDVAVAPPCFEMPGEAINGLKQQWLTRLAVGSFFDMHLRSGSRAEQANEFFLRSLSSENPEVRLTLPRKG